METPNLTLGPGLYQVGLIYAESKRAKKTAQFYCEGLADSPLQAYQKAENQLYIKTGKAMVIRENIITLVTPSQDTPETSYFDPDY